MEWNGISDAKSGMGMPFLKNILSFSGTCFMDENLSWNMSKWHSFYPLLWTEWSVVRKTGHLWCLGQYDENSRIQTKSDRISRFETWITQEVLKITAWNWHQSLTFSKNQIHSGLTQQRMTFLLKTSFFSKCGFFLQFPYLWNYPSNAELFRKKWNSRQLCFWLAWRNCHAFWGTSSGRIKTWDWHFWNQQKIFSAEMTLSSHSECAIFS